MHRFLIARLQATELCDDVCVLSSVEGRELARWPTATSRVSRIRLSEQDTVTEGLHSVERVRRVVCWCFVESVSTKCILFLAQSLVV